MSFDDSDDAPNGGRDESSRVTAWRLDHLLRLGFRPATAMLLAVGDVDLGDARRLVERGCPRATAAAILL